MKPKWIIEDFVNDPHYELLAAEAVRAGCECVHVRYVPFESGEYDHFGDDDCVIFFGSLNLGRQLRREKKWIPGVWCNLENLRCLSYYARWGRHLINSDGFWIPRAELRRRSQELLDMFGGSFFARPDSGFKCGSGLSGQVFKSDQSPFNYSFELIEEFTEPDSMFLVAHSKKILSEYRFFMSQAKGVVAGGRYKTEGRADFRPDYPDAAAEKAMEVWSEGWHPDPMYVVDIVETPEGWKMLEANSFSCSGVYLCDPAAIVTEANRMAEMEWQDSQPEN